MWLTCLAWVCVQGKGSREQGNLVVKEAVAAMMHKWNSAFRSVETFGHACGPASTPVLPCVAEDALQLQEHRKARGEKGAEVLLL